MVHVITTLNAAEIKSTTRRVTVGKQKRNRSETTGTTERSGGEGVVVIRRTRAGGSRPRPRLCYRDDGDADIVIIIFVVVRTRRPAKPPRADSAAGNSRPMIHTRVRARTGRIVTTTTVRRDRRRVPCVPGG